jgi:hypothetical protein
VVDLAARHRSGRGTRPTPSGGAAGAHGLRPASSAFNSRSSMARLYSVRDCSALGDLPRVRRGFSCHRNGSLRRRRLDGQWLMWEHRFRRPP